MTQDYSPEALANRRASSKAYHKAKRSTQHYQDRQRTYMAGYYARFKAALESYKLEKGCIDCGYRDNPAALQFDHVRGPVKKISPCTTKSIKRAIKEAEENCEVRCANCHAIKTTERGTNRGGWLWRPNVI